jgi:cell division protein FtsB
MNPVEVNSAVKQLIQWDADRIAALVTGLIFGAIVVWWVMHRLRPKPATGAIDVEISNEQLAQMKAKFQRLTAEKQELEDQLQQLRDENQSLQEENERLKAAEPGSGSAGEEVDLDDIFGAGTGSERVVYYQGRKYRFCGYGPNNCRIQELDGSKPSFLAKTHLLYHDAEGKQRITRDSIVVKR